MTRSTPLALRGGVAVITGAASGIGAALALQMAARGCHLALVDVNSAGLEAVAEQARAQGVNVTTQVLDMALPESAQSLLTEVTARHGRATVLVNNAGVALSGHFEQLAPGDFDWLMSINFSAVVRLTRAFLPLLRQAPAAQIVNISSIFGIIAPPGQTAYCAAKFAVRGFSESLRHELETARSPVGVTLVHPGGVRTGIAANARLPAGLSAAELKLHQDNCAPGPAPVARGRRKPHPAGHRAPRAARAGGRGRGGSSLGAAVLPHHLLEVGGPRPRAPWHPRHMRPPTRIARC